MSGVKPIKTVSVGNLYYNRNLKSVKSEPTVTDYLKAKIPPEVMARIKRSQFKKI